MDDQSKKQEPPPTSTPIEDQGVRDAESFQIVQEEARAAKKDRLRSGESRKELLESLRKSIRGSGTPTDEQEARRQEFVRKVREGTLTDLAAEARNAHVRLLALRKGGRLSQAGVELESEFGAAVESYAENRKILERIERELHGVSRPQESGEDQKVAKSLASLRTVAQAETLRGDVAELEEYMICVFERLDDRVQADLYEEESSRAFLNACISVLDRETRRSVMERVRARSRNASLEQRWSVLRSTVETLAQETPAVTKQAHAFARKRARLALRAEKYDDAAKELEYAIHLERGDTETWRLLVRTHSRRGDTEAAQAARVELLELCPDDIKLRIQVAADWESRGDKERAVAEYERVLSHDPNDSGVRYKLASLLYAVRAYERIPDILQDHTDSYPDDPKPLLWMGASWWRRGQHRTAIPYLKRAFDMAPDKCELALFLVTAYREAALYREALEAVEAHRRALPTCVRSYVLKGDILQACGMLPDAEALYLKAIELGQSSPAIYVALGNVRVDQGNIDGAIAAFEQAGQLAPKDPTALLELGKALRRLEKHEKAESALRKALELNDKDADIKHELSMLYVDRGEWEKAAGVLG